MQWAILEFAKLHIRLDSDIVLAIYNKEMQALQFKDETFSLEKNYFEDILVYSDINYYQRLEPLPNDTSSKTVGNIIPEPGVHLGVMVDYGVLKNQDAFLFRLLQLYKIRSEAFGSLVIIELGMF